MAASGGSARGCCSSRTRRRRPSNRGGGVSRPGRAYVDARVGREPLETAYRAKHLAERLAGRRAPVKAAILDQRTVAGVGNIYADEALWRARLHPLTSAEKLEPHEVKALYKGIRDSLRAGIRRQGSTLRDYRLPDGGEG